MHMLESNDKIKFRGPKRKKIDGHLGSIARPVTSPQPTIAWAKRYSTSDMSVSFKGVPWMFDTYVPQLGSLGLFALSV